MALGLSCLGAAVEAQSLLEGTVRSSEGLPVIGAQIFVESLGLGALTTDSGEYVLTIPTGEPGTSRTVTLTVRQVGFKPVEAAVTVPVDGLVTQDFVLEVDPFLLEAIIVTGQGLESERRQVGSTINTVRAEEIRESREANVINALAAKAPNVEVTSSAGDPGAGAYIRIRGTRSIVGGTQPLIVVDGTPINNESHAHDAFSENPVDGAPFQNRAADLNPADIESIEILKGAAAAGIYGSRASNGVVLITTRSGPRDATRWTLRSSVGLDRVTQLPGLQSRFGQGLDQTVIGDTGVQSHRVSYGAELDSTVAVFDHAGELFGTGTRTDNVLTLEGGTDRTVYYLSLGYAFQDGTIKGNSSFERTTARLKASHDFGRSLRIGGNFAYTTSSGDVIQQGSNLSGLLLGALRTPPEFDNCLPDADPCYTDPATGLHRSYRLPNPTTDTEWRIYDNPFWVANEILNTTDVDRVFGNLSLEYEPSSSLRVRYLLGADFSNDQRLSLFPRSSSDYWTVGLGRILRQELVDDILDQSVLVTLRRDLSESLDATLTLGHNLNRKAFTELTTEGADLLPGATHLDHAAELEAWESETTVKTEGYFAEATLEAWDQLFLRGGLRGDAASTFGGDLRPDGRVESNRFWYPTASVAWEFSSHLESLDFGKLRIGYGVAGVQPPPNSSTTGFVSLGVLQGLQQIGYPLTRGNPSIGPERTRELEVGAEISFADDRIAIGLTRYWQKTSDAILAVTLPPETGFYETLRNGAQWRNWGWEATLDAIPWRTPSVTWRVGLQWGQNRSMVDELRGAESAFLGGFFGGGSVTSSVVAGYPLPVILGPDFVRFGRGSFVDGVSIDDAYTGWISGDLYVGTDGFPVPDLVDRVIGDPNPDWTGSLRNSLTLFNRVTVSALVDVKWGGDMWNGTKQQLVFFGTHEESEPFHGEGVDTVFAGMGPGAGTEVNLNWATWSVVGPVGFGGVASPYVEDAGFIKLRDVSVSTTWESEWLGRMGFGPVDVTLSGRNLVTWTDYSGIDPESNLTGQTAGRGLEYFNNPQTRSFLLTLTVRR